MSVLARRTCNLCIRTRAFSTTPPRAVSLQIEKNDPEAVADAVPEYPYGPARWYKQSNKGLYGGQRIQFGNNVSVNSHKTGKHTTKTRRRFEINVFTKRLWSVALQRNVQLRVSARTLRTIDKLGGLDEYLLGDKEMRIKALGVSGWWLRWAIMQTDAVKQRFAVQRVALGVPADGVKAVVEGSKDVSAEAEETGLSQELEEALDALPEVEADVEEVMKAQSDSRSELDNVTVEEVESSTGSPNTSENIFRVEHAPDLQPLKFRVGKGNHIMLTPRGWVRTKPTASSMLRLKKRKMVDQRYTPYIVQHVEKFKAELDQHASEFSLTDTERQTALRFAKLSFTKDAWLLFDKEFEKESRAKFAMQKNTRKMRKRARKAKESSRIVEI